MGWDGIGWNGKGKSLLFADTVIYMFISNHLLSGNQSLYFMDIQAP